MGKELELQYLLLKINGEKFQSKRILARETWTEPKELKLGLREGRVWGLLVFEQG